MSLLPSAARRWACIHRLSTIHKARNLGQRFSDPDVVLIGEYHGANVGDMAMGHALKRECYRAGRKSVFQTLHNLNRWPEFGNAVAVVGGGTVLTTPQINRLKQRYAKNPQQLSILGVNYICEEDVQRDAAFLRSIHHLSLRSRSQAVRVQEILKSDNVSYQPDLAFGLFDASLARPKKQTGVVGWNCLPLYASWNGSQWAATDHFAGVKGEHWIREQLAFESTGRALIKRWSVRRSQVVHVPFAVEDWHFAEQFVGRDSSVRQMSYISDPLSVINEISDYEMFVSTRFHSLVLALVAGTPVVPLPYSRKCIDLLHDLGWTQFDDLQPRSAMESFEAATLCVENVKPIVLASDVLGRLRDEAMAPLLRVLAES